MITGTLFNHDYLCRKNGKPGLWSGEKYRSENLFLHRELAGLGFLANFAKEVGVSLNPDEVLNRAAKLLYNHFHYSLAVFVLAEGFGGLSGYSPLDPAGCRRSWLRAVEEFPDFKYRSISGHRFLGLATPLVAMDDDTCPVVLELGDNIGTIKLYCGEEDANLAGVDILAGIAGSLTVALRNAREHDRVKELSLRDSLTGLYNRRVLEEILHLEENKRKPSPLSILIFDVDDFKIINDSFGHPAGDQVLAAIGKMLADNTRKETIVARIGGEEFALLLTNTGLDTALQIAERLRSKLGEQEFNFSGRKVRLSVSIGVAHNAGDAPAQQSLMSRADQALYQAKRSGKNRVCFHGEEHMPRMPEKRRRAPLRIGAGRFDGALTA
jgi:two-component system, cell cycle response regulator